MQTVLPYQPRETGEGVIYMVCVLCGMCFMLHVFYVTYALCGMCFMWHMFYVACVLGERNSNCSP